MSNEVAVDMKGNLLPYSEKEVRSIIADALETGTVRLVVMEKDGDYMVQVYGPPSAKLLAVLEDATNGYRRALRVAQKGQ